LIRVQRKIKDPSTWGGQENHQKMILKKNDFEEG
jgi:hypothetical protein